MTKRAERKVGEIETVLGKPSRNEAVSLIVHFVSCQQHYFYNCFNRVFFLKKKKKRKRIDMQRLLRGVSMMDHKNILMSYFRLFFNVKKKI